MLTILLVGLLPVIASTQTSALDRFLLSFIIITNLTYSVVPSYITFFPDHHWMAPVVWLALSAVIASTYCLAKNGLGIVLAVLVQSIPPIGIFNVISPLSASGLFFPAWGLVGVVLYLILIGVAAQKITCLPRDCKTINTSRLIVLIMLSLFSNLFAYFHVEKTPDNWHGVNTAHVMPAGNNLFKALNNTATVITSGDILRSESKILVFPEAILDNMYGGTTSMVSDNVPAGQSWLIGAEDGNTDSIYLFKHNKPAVKLFTSAMPMPVSMWNPFNKKSYSAGWVEPVQIIDGKRVWASICYEQVLPWTWVEAAIQRPDLILLVNNEWWAVDNSATEIQADQAHYWIRLLNVAAVSATNR